MKRLTFTVLFGLVTGVATMNAQTSVISVSVPGEEGKKSAIDKVLFIAQYEMAFVRDTSHLDRITEETMMLKVGEKSSHFYSYTKFVTDSLLRVQLAQSGGVIRQQISMGGGSNPGMITYQIYKNYPAGKATTLEHLGLSRFRCEETNECPEWQILSDTTTILSHLCYKATCRFKGRDYAAWFTPAIPRSEGPWKLCGLPGLILHAEDSRKHYVFECTGLINVQPDEMILYGDDNYEPVSRNTLNKTYERAVADPIGFMTASNPNVQVKVMTPDGEAINPSRQNNPYNPIELSEQ